VKRTTTDRQRARQKLQKKRVDVVVANHAAESMGATTPCAHRRRQHGGAAAMQKGDVAERIVTISRRTWRARTRRNRGLRPRAAQAAAKRARRTSAKESPMKIALLVTAIIAAAMASPCANRSRRRRRCGSGSAAYVALSAFAIYKFHRDGTLRDALLPRRAT